MKLLTHEPWNLNIDKCPYDVDFSDMAHVLGWEKFHIFHVGTGMHHHVGRNLSERNTVLSLTCSIEEAQAYIEWAVETPARSGRYQCLFGDMYMLEPWTLPMFDVISLPHFGETEDVTRLDYGAKTDEEIWGLMLQKLAPGGQIFGYNRSAAWDRAKEFFYSLGEPTISHKSVLGWSL